MYQDYHWNDNDNEPGLFTFYVEQETSQTEMRNQDPTRLSNHSNEPQIKKQFKLRKGVQRYTSSCAGWNIKSCLQKKESKILKRGNLSERKNQSKKSRNLQSIQNVSSNKLKKQPSPKTNNKKSEVELKKRNMNDCFGFDINKCKSKMFIFRGEPVRLLRKNYKEVVNTTPSLQKGERKQSKTYKSLSNLPNRNKAINSEVQKRPTIKLRYNFVQFLNQRKKRQKIDKFRQRSSNRNDLTLERLLCLSKHEMEGARSKTER